MKVKLKDIATNSGYSVSTVSRVLAGSENISLAARKVILQTAFQLGYPLSETHEISEAKNDTDVRDVVALVTGFAVGEFYAALYRGLHESAISNNIRLYLLGITNKHEVFDFIEDLKNHNFDGAILFAPEFNHRDYKKFKSLLPRNFPVVSNGPIENPVFTTISFDGYSGGYLAAKHLQQRGYKKLGIVRGPIERAESRFRANGFRDYIEQSAELQLAWSHEGNFKYDSGQKAFDEFNQLQDKPEALFICNDTMAFSFMVAARDNNVSIPQDVAIVGYDNQTISWQFSPSLTTINTDYQRLGQASFDRLQDLIEDSNPHQGVFSQIPVGLIQREST